MDLSGRRLESGRLERRHLRVTGVVQGVGFRPFVYGLARRLGIAGLVGNDSHGVFIELEGQADALDAFHAELIHQPPPLAHIVKVDTETVDARGDTDFIIVESEAQAGAHTLVSPDLAVCDDCLRELFDPADRRYRYPFINCTNCGPRFTIITDIPYDRPLTTMAAFPLCPDCEREYRDPLDRRFHAQPIACPVCGPRLQHVVREGEAWRVVAGDPLLAAQRLLNEGRVVAVKGLGGYHLACDATSDVALTTLRERKGRIDKPFAVMARDLAAARAIAEINEEEHRLLGGRERPIVLLKAAVGSPLSALVAPGNDSIGVMLPYTPLHHLLLAEPAPPVLVMTSANFSNEPIVKDDDVALEQFRALADAILLHDRSIHVHCDDSVVRVFEGRESPIRRSRGYAPFPVRLPFDARPILAVGGELKATFCLARGDEAFMSQHIGDMENLETEQAFERALDHLSGLFRITPEIVAADLHPGYLATQWADRRYGRAVMKVQHHHAHIASVMAENGVAAGERVIGFSFDGTGYGVDGAIWGGEVLVADYAGFERAAHLAYVPLPGGDASVRHPARTALAYLWAAGLSWDPGLAPVAALDAIERGVLGRQLETGFQIVPCSSFGRLFDAVAALAGVRQSVSYEAQAAIELEAFVEKRGAKRERRGATHGSAGDEGAYAFAWRAGTPAQIDWAPVIAAVADDARAGVSAATIGAKFHAAAADLILGAALRLRDLTGLSRVALSGGVFQNVTLLRAALAGLQGAGFDVLWHKRVPANDGGLALGQMAIAQFTRIGL
jgi:hydrogenase maturation protein HypF